MTIRIFAAMLILWTVSAHAAPRTDSEPRPVVSSKTTLVSHGLSATKSDTVTIFGGPVLGNGDFQNDLDPSLPDWEGWVGVDRTAITESRWHIDTYNSPTGTAAVWCGEVLESCGPEDPPQGYGNSYEEYLAWTGSVTDPGLDTDVTVSFTLNYDNEPGYDYLYLQRLGPGGWTNVATFNGSTYDAGSGTFVPEIPIIVFTVPASDLAGAGGDEVRIRFRATSDGGWSDSDCLWPTAGLAQVDEVSVSGTNGLPTTMDDFESGLEASNWELAFKAYYGNYSKIWPLLDALDPCVQNDSPQAAFIDDGVVEPCSDGSLGSTWTYGPGGYVVNQGGCSEFSYVYGWNEVWSPPIAWVDPATGVELGATHKGGVLDFGVWPHTSIDSRQFYVWRIRSSSDFGSTWTEWRDRHFIYYGHQQYGRMTQDVTDLVELDPSHVQIALGLWESAWSWILPINDPTPGPYFDNVRFDIFPLTGPTITINRDDLAQDAFPASGTLDHSDLASNSIRFDSVVNTTGWSAVIPADSLVCSITTNRSGAALTQKPRLYYTMKPNSLFDPHRVHPTNGWVEGDTVRTSQGMIEPDLWSFDLPDTAFFYPGDVIQYFIHAEDDVGGDVKATTLPASSSGYGVFPGDPGYDPLLWPADFTVRGLPSMNSPLPGDQPAVLFWDDDEDRPDDERWEPILAQLGYTQGVDYDIYRTQAASQGEQNGLGARATPDHVAGYSTILYSFGDLTRYSLEYHDRVLLNDWITAGGNLFVSGDNILQDLTERQGSGGLLFASSRVSASLSGRTITDLIDNQPTPLVTAIPGNPVDLALPFIADGGCPELRDFDAITPIGDAVILAEWTDPGGGGGAYPYAAALAHEEAGSRVVTLPVDLPAWRDQDGGDRARLHALAMILDWFGETVPGGPTAVAEVPRSLSVHAYPNPFNPSTTVAFDVPRRGPVTVTVYDVRGRKVKRLADGVYEAGMGYEATWAGDDDTGRAAATGAYFVEVRHGGRTVVEKVVMVK